MFRMHVMGCRLHARAATPRHASPPIRPPVPPVPLFGPRGRSPTRKTGRYLYVHRYPIASTAGAQHLPTVATGSGRGVLVLTMYIPTADEVPCFVFFCFLFCFFFFFGFLFCFVFLRFFLAATTYACPNVDIDKLPRFHGGRGAYVTLRTYLVWRGGAGAAVRCTRVCM